MGKSLAISIFNTSAHHRKLPNTTGIAVSPISVLVSRVFEIGFGTKKSKAMNVDIAHGYNG